MPERIFAVTDLGVINVGDSRPYDIEYLDGFIYTVAEPSTGDGRNVPVYQLYRKETNTLINRSDSRVTLDTPALPLGDLIILGATLARSRTNTLEMRIQYIQRGFTTTQVAVAGVVVALSAVLSAGFSALAFSGLGTGAFGGSAIATAGSLFTGLTSNWAYVTLIGWGSLTASAVSQSAVALSVATALTTSALAAADDADFETYTLTRGTQQFTAASKDIAQPEGNTYVPFTGMDASADSTDNWYYLEAGLDTSISGFRSARSGYEVNAERIAELLDLKEESEAVGGALSPENAAMLARLQGEQPGLERTYFAAILRARRINLVSVSGTTPTRRAVSNVSAMTFDGTSFWSIYQSTTTEGEYLIGSFNPVTGQSTAIDDGSLNQHLDRLNLAYSYGGPMTSDGDGYLYAIVTEEIESVQATTTLTYHLVRIQITDLGLDPPTVSNQRFNLGERVDVSLPEATLGKAPYTYTLTGTIPAGLSFDASTRRFSGTVSSTALLGPNFLTYRVTDASGATAETSFTVFIFSNPFFPAVSLGPYQAGVQVPATTLPEVLGAGAGETANYTYNTSGRPPGMPLINFRTRQIAAWTPTTAGTYSMVYQAIHPTLPNAELRIPIVITPRTRAANRPPTVRQPQPIILRFNEAINFIPFGSDPDGDTLTWSATNLPSWCRFNSRNGRITGIASVGGANTTITLTATDPGGLSDSTTLLISVGARPVPPTDPTDPQTPVNPYFPGTLPQEYLRNTAIPTLQLSEMQNRGNAIYRYSATGLPPGLVFNATLRRITGTPTTTGFYTVTYTATRRSGTDGLASYSQTFNIEIYQEGGLSQTNFGPYTYNSLIPQRLQLSRVTGGEAGVSYTYSVSGLPNEVIYAPFAHSLTPRVVGGRWRTPGTHNCTLTAVPSDGSTTLTAPFTIIVGQIPVIERPPSQSSLNQSTIRGTLGRAVARELARVRNAPPGVTYNYTLTGTLPAGLVTTPAAATITGVPTAIFRATMTLTATVATGTDENAPLTSVFAVIITAPAGQPNMNIFVESGFRNIQTDTFDDEFDDRGRVVFNVPSGTNISFDWTARNLLAGTAAMYPLRVLVGRQSGSDAAAPNFSYDSGIFNNLITDGDNSDFQYAEITSRGAEFPRSATVSSAEVRNISSRGGSWTGIYTFPGSTTTRRDTISWQLLDDTDQTERNKLRNLVGPTVTSGTVTGIYRFALEIEPFTYWWNRATIGRPSNDLDDPGAGGVPYNVLGYLRNRQPIATSINFSRVLLVVEIKVVWHRDLPFRWAGPQRGGTVNPRRTGAAGRMPFVQGTVGGRQPVVLRVFGRRPPGVPGEEQNRPWSSLDEPDGTEYGRYAYSVTARDARGIILWRTFSIEVPRR